MRFGLISGYHSHQFCLFPPISASLPLAGPEEVSTAAGTRWHLHHPSLLAPTSPLHPLTLTVSGGTETPFSPRWNQSASARPSPVLRPTTSSLGREVHPRGHQLGFCCSTNAGPAAGTSLCLFNSGSPALRRGSKPHAGDKLTQRQWHETLLFFILFLLSPHEAASLNSYLVY